MALFGAATANSPAEPLSLEEKPAMDDFLSISLLSLAMLIGCYVAGIIPLAVNFSEVRKGRSEHLPSRCAEECKSWFFFTSEFTTDIEVGGGGGCKEQIKPAQEETKILVK